MIVDEVILDNPVYVNNYLQVVDISFMYTQEVCGLFDIDACIMGSPYVCAGTSRCHLIRNSFFPCSLQ